MLGTSGGCTQMLSCRAVEKLSHSAMQSAMKVSLTLQTHTQRKQCKLANNYSCPSITAGNMQLCLPQAQLMQEP